MPRAGSEIPPPLELECLKALWKLGESNVRSVRDALAPDHVLAYTTVMTLLERLARKGAVERKKVGRHFVYTPTVSREALRAVALKRLVDAFFDGSEADLIAYLGAPRPDPPPQPPPVRLEEDALDPALL